VALTTLLFGQLVAWCEVHDVPVVPTANTGTQTMRNGKVQVYMESVGLFHQVCDLVLTLSFCWPLHVWPTFGLICSLGAIAAGVTEPSVPDVMRD